MKAKYKPSFFRMFKKLPLEVQLEVREKLVLFTDPDNHERLRVHKLKGKLKHLYAFSVTYSHRVVFSYIEGDDDTVIFIAIGSHDVYK